MKVPRKQKCLTFGDFVVAVYGACSKRKASKIVRVAVNTHLVEFQGRQRYVIV